MEIQSDGASVDSSDALKLNVKIKGNVPRTPAATIFIDPYSGKMSSVWHLE